MKLLTSCFQRNPYARMRRLLQDYRAIEKLWTDAVIHTPGKDVVEIARKMGGVEIKVLPDAAEVPYRAACSRKRFSKSSLVETTGSDRPDYFEQVSHELVHAGQNKFKQTMMPAQPLLLDKIPLLKRLFKPHEEAFEAYFGIMSRFDKLTDSLSKFLHPHYWQEIERIIGDLPDQALHLLKKRCRSEIQAYGLTLEHADYIGLSKTRTQQLLDFHRKIRTMVKQEQNRRAGLLA